MSQTIEELITAKEQELGLNETELKALKDYAKQVSTLVKANEILLNEKVQDAASKNKINTALKTTSGVAKGVGIGADISIYVQQGDSLGLAITKAIVDAVTADTIDKIILRGFGNGANLVEYALNLGDVTVGLKSVGTLAAEDAVTWTGWAWNYYIGPNVTIDHTFTQNGQTKILFTCKHFTTLKSLHVRNKIQHKRAKRGEETMVA